MKERHGYLDILKFIAITFVCFYHFSMMGDVSYAENMPFDVLFRRFIFNTASSCVPLFFMVNGALLLNKSCDLMSHAKKTLLLLMQFFLWRIITVALIEGYKGNGLLDHGIEALFNFILLTDYFPEYSLTLYWFLQTLLALYLIFPFLKNAYDPLIAEPKKISALHILLLAIFVFWFLTNDLRTLLQHIGLGGIHVTRLRALLPFSGLLNPMLFYFILGGLLQHAITRIKKTPLVYWVIAYCVGLALLMGEWMAESAYSHATFDAVFEGYATLPCLMMTLSLYAIAAKIKLSPRAASFFHVMGRNTLAVYFLHAIFGHTVLTRIQELVPQRGIFVNTVKALLMVFAFSGVGELLRRLPIVKKLV